ncbi:alpha/beta hydrolase [Gordonia sp. (in: high G+C Gram-positive bacteria)]|uniref:poly(ethylene terephthalate) hydrolase family protein n=1 Tax=Gordonia sp. (in: high G+C Gram-positive bacteria) TaxID=84139 RepID=UPI0025B8A799|nr:alpha/beta hydrolase [Gordonia sp. (in: high G+C Gram-positive bacteria)]
MFGNKKVVAPPPDKLMKELARRGPEKVDRGDLGIVGMSGQVFAPRTGRGLPAVVFGHGWLVGSARYRDLLFHLASWGIVVAAPDGSRGPFPSDIEFGTDLRAAATVVSSVRLGTGAISVDPTRIGVAGHGFGAAAAVRAASDAILLGRPPVDVKALAAVFPAPTTADLSLAASSVTAPALVVAGAAHLSSMTGNALDLAENLGGDVALRTLAGASDRDLIETPSVRSLIGVNGADKSVHAAVRAQLTGFFLHRLTGDEKYAAFSDPDQTMGEVLAVDVPNAERPELDNVSQLLGSKARSA